MKAEKKKYGSAKIDPQVLYEAKVYCVAKKISLFGFLTDTIKKELKKVV